jgi:3-oxoacyl-[acyl-carrier-protein] synthase II
MSYYICGIGFVTSDSFGCGKDFDRFSPTNTPHKPITRKDVLDEPYKPFGRMDCFSKTGFAGIYFAYKDAGLIESNSNNEDTTSNTSIIASTLYGCLDTDKNFFDTIKSENGKNASPALFAYTLPNTFLGEASIYLKATGETFVLKENNLKGLTALKMSFDLLDSDESDFVICGLCDSLNTDSFKELFNIKKTPFSGSLFLTISKEKLQSCYGEIEEDKNGSIFFDGIHIENLLELAQVCIKNKKIKLKEKLLL